MDEPTRRAWSKPQLIVIRRGRPEEAVLGTCKAFDGTNGPPEYSNCLIPADGMCSSPGSS